MNNRRKFLAVGGALAALSVLPETRADQRQPDFLYIHGLVWNRQLSAPMNDWLIRLDAKVDIPVGASPGFATFSDDFHDPVGSHAQLQSAILNGNQLTLTGTITESKTTSLVGQPVRIEGKLEDDNSVDGLTVTIGASKFNGAGTATGHSSGRRFQIPGLP